MHNLVILAEQRHRLPLPALSTTLTPFFFPGPKWKCKDWLNSPSMTNAGSYLGSKEEVDLSSCSKVATALLAPEDSLSPTPAAFLLPLGPRTWGDNKHSYLLSEIQTLPYFSVPTSPSKIYVQENLHVNHSKLNASYMFNVMGRRRKEGNCAGKRERREIMHI